MELLKKTVFCVGMAVISLLSSSCNDDDDIYPSDRVCLTVGESRVVEFNKDVDIYENSVNLKFEDTGVCSLSDIKKHQVTVTGLHRGVDILHIEYATKKSKTGYSAFELRIEVE